MNRKVLSLSIMVFLSTVPCVGSAETGLICGKHPNVSTAIDAITSDIVAKTPVFKNIDPTMILFTAADARHRSRATTRPTRFKNGKRQDQSGRYEKPTVTFQGREIAYMIELRPLFFRESTVEERIKTIFHELMHISGRFDGTIQPELSHKSSVEIDFEASITPMVNAYITRADPALLRPLAADGEIKARQWLYRPPFRLPAGDLPAMRSYSEKELFEGPLEMITKTSPLKRILLKEPGLKKK